jgi:hypothetical protein
MQMSQHRSIRATWQMSRREQDQHRMDQVVDTEGGDAHSAIRRARRRALRRTEGHTPSKMGRNGTAKVGPLARVDTRQWHRVAGVVTMQTDLAHDARDQDKDRFRSCR